MRRFQALLIAAGLAATSASAAADHDPSPDPLDPEWSGMRWLQDLMKPFAQPQEQTANRFEDEWFHQFHEWLHPAQPNEASLRSRGEP